MIGSADLAVFLYDQGRLTHAESMAAIKALRSSKKQKRDAMIALEITARGKGDQDATP